jgi:nucleotide-binding universal stress UspA family protein
MYKKILVPLDGSLLAEVALGPATALARRTDAEVILLRVPALERILITVRGSTGVLWPDQALEHSRQEAQLYLDARARALRDDGVNVQSEVLEGDIASVIIDRAEALGADLIALSTHGYSGVTRWMLGSVTAKVLRSTALPVLVVRAGRPLHRVLVPLDGSPLAERALGPALELARHLSHTVTLLRVIDDAVPVSRGDLRRLERVERGLGQTADGFDLYDETRASLERLAHRWRRPELPVEVEVDVGDAAECIITHAVSKGIDLVAMATHGRTGLARWVYGSVTDKVMRAAPCSMLVVRPPAADLN